MRFLSPVVSCLLLSTALVLAGPAVSLAQSRPTVRPPMRPPVRRPGSVTRPGAAQPKPRAQPTTVMAKDGFQLQGGRVLSTELGLTNPLAADKKLPNGTSISPSGQLSSPSGTTTQLAEGDYVSLTGRLTTRRETAAADSTRKLVEYDLKHPGKRKELEKAREKAEKAKAKADKEKAKAEAKANRK